ncbi:hypothetical protein ACHAQJ_001771 [Trichoderma viride]
MAQKTWFFPPSFDFFPDGEISLGSIIPYPNRPTFSIATLSSLSDVDIVPQINTFTEADHNHTRTKSTSLATEVFLKLMNLALEIGNVDVSRFTKTTYGKVDLETRVYSSSLSSGALKTIVELAGVKKHVDNGMFGKRPIYIISGLRIAKDSFEVTSESKWTNLASARVSTSITTGSFSPTTGSNVANKREQKTMDSYKAAPGVVFAYRLHVIRIKKDGHVETELFSHRTAFLTGEAEDEDLEVEWECRGVTANVLLDDMEVDPSFDEYSIGDGEESCIAFKHK